MGSCAPAEQEGLLLQAPEFERHLVRAGVNLFKCWFPASRGERRLGFLERHAPLAPGPATKGRPLKWLKCLSPLPAAAGFARETPAAGGRGGNLECFCLPTGASRPCPLNAVLPPQNLPRPLPRARAC